MPLVTHVVSVMLAVTPQPRDAVATNCSMFDTPCKIKEIESRETFWQHFAALWTGADAIEVR